MHAMKRICYLLTFFLTGFTLVANEKSHLNTNLFACNAEVYQLTPEAKLDCRKSVEEAMNLSFFRRHTELNPAFICLAEK